MDDTPKPKIVIEFVEPGSAHFDVQVDPTITPMQLWVIAHWAEFEANFAMSVQKQAIMQQAMRQQEMSRIVVPNSGAERLMK